MNVSGHHTNPDLGILIDKSASHRVAVKIVHQHDGTVGKSSGNTLDLIIKYPGTARFQGTPFAFFQCNYCVTHIVFSSLCLCILCLLPLTVIPENFTMHCFLCSVLQNFFNLRLLVPEAFFPDHHIIFSFNRIS